MTGGKTGEKRGRVRGQIETANSAPVAEVAKELARLFRRHHLNYDQTKHAVELARKEVGLRPPATRARTLARLDRGEVERLVEHAYRRGPQYGLMVKTLFYTGARVSEFINIRPQDLHLDLDPPQVRIVVAKGGSDGYVPILPALAQELRTHLGTRTEGYLFESNRHNQYTPRMVQKVVKDAATAAGFGKAITPHRLRASVATILLDAGMPLDQVQKFLRHKRIATTQIYAETSVKNLADGYVRALR